MVRRVSTITYPHCSDEFGLASWAEMRLQEAAAGLFREKPAPRGIPSVAELGYLLGYLSAKVAGP